METRGRNDSWRVPAEISIGGKNRREGLEMEVSHACSTAGKYVDTRNAQAWPCRYLAYRNQSAARTEFVFTSADFHW